MKNTLYILFVVGVLFLQPSSLYAGFEQHLFDPGHLAPIDSKSTLAVGDKAPDFELPSIGGPNVQLSDFQGKKNVLLSFVPAAWTPVCSGQWPGYNILEEEFAQKDTVLLGLSVDNIPTLFSWTEAMGHLWFPVLSDFWPHGAVAKAYGILRSSGTSERALFLIDKQGIIRYIDITDINTRPELGSLMQAIDNLPK